MTGLERMSAVADGRLPQPPIGVITDMSLVEADDGRVLFRGRPGAAHLNLLDAVHGAYCALLLDSALGCAAFTKMPAGVGCSTVSFEMKLVRPLAPGREVEAEGRVMHAGHSQVTAVGEVHAVDDGELLAHASATCLVLRPNPR